MAGRPRKNAVKSAKSVAKTKKVAEKTEVIETPVVEEVIVEMPVAEEVIAETPVAEEVIAEATVVAEEEVKSEEEKPAEIKSKRKYTRRNKTVETPVEEETKPKRKYTKRAKSVETPVETPETPAEDTSAPKFEAYIQGAGAERSFEELAEIATKLSGVKSPKSVSLYIKPYEHDGIAKVYYVVDNKAGHFNLF